MSDEDVEAKRRYIEDYFDDLEHRVSFTSELRATGHWHEAMLLCCCYIEGLGNWLSSNPASPTRSFCDALARFGGEPVFQLTIPRQAQVCFPWKSASPLVKASLTTALESLPPQEAFELEEVIERLLPVVSAEAIEFLKSEAWRATVAAVVYNRIRSRLVHGLSSADFITFSVTTYQGNPLPEIGFQMLHDALSRIVKHARRESLESGKFYGHA
jgi:hypothetical protein